MWALFFLERMERKKGINTMSMNMNINDFRATKFDDYFVNAEGDVLSLKGKTPRLLSQVTVNGYKMVIMYNDGKAHLEYVHRLVAELFIDNPNSYNEINHIDENKANNNVNNLEWCTREYNINYGTRTERQSRSMKQYWKQRKAV